MKLHQHLPGEHYFIRACDAHSITVNQQRLESSCIVMPQQLLADWPVRHIDQLAAEHIRQLGDLDIEILLLGTGPRQHFPDQRLVLPLADRGIGVEFMTTDAACRTFNILMQEGRAVAAALILEPVAS